MRATRIEQDIVNETAGERISTEPLPDMMLRIIAGRLVPYFPSMGDSLELS